jgi:hypothetical protein
MCPTLSVLKENYPQRAQDVDDTAAPLFANAKEYALVRTSQLFDIHHSIIYTAFD